MTDVSGGTPAAMTNELTPPRGWNRLESAVKMVGFRADSFSVKDVPDDSGSGRVKKKVEANKEVRCSQSGPNL